MIDYINLLVLIIVLIIVAILFLKKKNDGDVYRNNIASSDILREPGYCDLTSHLCLETLDFFAKKSGWEFLGEVKQGQALLSLGLSQKLHALQYLTKENLRIALEKRENLLRLVDPAGLGGFRWMAYQINNESFLEKSPLYLSSKFLKEPTN